MVIDFAFGSSFLLDAYHDLVIQPNIVLSWICEALDSIRKVREGSQEGRRKV